MGREGTRAYSEDLIKVTKSGKSYKLIRLACVKCNKIYERPKNSYKSKVDCFTCITCSNNSRRGKSNTWLIGQTPANFKIKCIVECRYCGAKKSKTKRQLETSPRTFCNSSCQVKWQNKFTDFNKDSKNPSYTDGSRVNGKTPNYGNDFTTSLKRSVKIRDSFNCQECLSNFSGKKSKQLDVHHIDKNRYNNSMDNLVSLCKSCHTKLHWDKLEKGSR